MGRDLCYWGLVFELSAHNSVRRWKKGSESTQMLRMFYIDRLNIFSTDFNLRPADQQNKYCFTKKQTQRYKIQGVVLICIITGVKEKV